MKAFRARTITIATLLLLLTALAGLGTLVLRGTHDTGRDAGSGRPDGDTQSVDLARDIADYTSRFTPDGGYLPPSRTDRRLVTDGVALLLDGHREQAELRLAEVDFGIRTLVDSATGRRFAEVYDRVDQAPHPRGWGRVYVDLDHRARWSVQVPHPVADQGTEQLGVRVLRGTPGGILIVAGAHRKSGEGDASDVAHRRDTVFHAVCAELVRRGFPGVQLHGFADDSAPDHDVVASTGKGSEGRADGRRLADALRDRGFAVCRAWVRSCPLEGRENVQGRTAADEDVPFLHVEFARSVRSSDTRAAEAAAAVRVVTSRWDAAAGVRR